MIVWYFDESGPYVSERSSILEDNKIKFYENNQETIYLLTDYIKNKKLCYIPI